MIEQIEDSSLFDDWKKKDIYTVRILALLKSYGTAYRFATFYRQIIDGKITAILSKLDNDVTLALDDGFDNEELVRFFCITGHGTVLCDPAFQIGAKFEEGVIMSSKVKRDLNVMGAGMIGISVDEYPKLMDLYNFIDYENQDFKSWYVDISHRVRHNTAKAYTLNVAGNIVTSSILSSIYDDDAVLTAVKTGKEYRRMGYGGYLVSYICNDIKGRVYIMRDAELNEHFYTDLGFKNIGIWRMYR